MEDSRASAEKQEEAGERQSAPNSSHMDGHGREVLVLAIYCENNFARDNKVRNMAFLSAFRPLRLPQLEEEEGVRWGDGEAS